MVYSKWCPPQRRPAASHLAHEHTFFLADAFSAWSKDHSIFWCSHTSASPSVAGWIARSKQLNMLDLYPGKTSYIYPRTLALRLALTRPSL